MIGGLTRAERAVLELVAAGLTNRQIAAARGLTEGTVRVYVARVLLGLGARNRTEAALIWWRAEAGAGQGCVEQAAPVVRG